jgi:hypothetical protein
LLLLPAWIRLLLLFQLRPPALQVELLLLHLLLAVLQELPHQASQHQHHHQQQLQPVPAVSAPAVSHPVVAAAALLEPHRALPPCLQLSAHLLQQPPLPLLLLLQLLAAWAVMAVP